jgi:hypothetical protein
MSGKPSDSSGGSEHPCGSLTCPGYASIVASISDAVIVREQVSVCSRTKNETIDRWVGRTGGVAQDVSVELGHGYVPPPPSDPYVSDMSRISGLRVSF